jgi:hypothetical protein
MILQYFDVESEGIDCERNKIITIQFQKINNEGYPVENLTILKEWEVGEEEIIKIIYNQLFNQSTWNFVPVGTNLIFDLSFLFAKFKKYNLKCPSLSDFLFSKPLIDIKSLLIMINNMEFKGHGLDKITNKKRDGSCIPIFYEQKKYSEIEDYVKQETQSFLEFLQKAIKLNKSLKKNE